MHPLRCSWSLLWTKLAVLDSSPTLLAQLLWFRSLQRLLRCDLKGSACAPWSCFTVGVITHYMHQP